MSANGRDGWDREFHDFVEQHLTDLGRFAYLLSGDRTEADDLAGDALLAAWSQWETVRQADSPVGYVRGILANKARSRIRRLIRERSKLVLFRADALSAQGRTPDTAAVVDVRAALRSLPRGQRECVVLRYAVGLSEAETAATLRISVGTVKSQTSLAAARLRDRLRVDIARIGQ